MNYYDVFGISPTASSDDINAAHKALAKMYHPDINDSDDSHERMALLNEANEILSDSAKREEYDKKLGITGPVNQEPNIEYSKYSHIINARWPGELKIPVERAEKAESLRKRAEARLKKVDMARSRRIEQEKKKAEEEDRRKRQIRADLDKQQVINELSSLVMGDHNQRNKSPDFDEERHNATKVLLSLVRKDNEHLRRIAEEAERKQRIEEILTLVKEYNEEADPDRFV